MIARWYLRNMHTATSTTSKMVLSGLMTNKDITLNRSDNKEGEFKVAWQWVRMSLKWFNYEQKLL